MSSDIVLHLNMIKMILQVVFETPLRNSIYLPSHQNLHCFQCFIIISSSSSSVVYYYYFFFFFFFFYWHTYCNYGRVRFQRQKRPFQKLERKRYVDKTSFFLFHIACIESLTTWCLLITPICSEGYKNCSLLVRKFENCWNEWLTVDRSKKVFQLEFRFLYSFCFRGRFLLCAQKKTKLRNTGNIFCVSLKVELCSVNVLFCISAEKNIITEHIPTFVGVMFFSAYLWR